MPHPIEGPPKRILLATDLGSRSDRALDRAALLAREFSAELIVAHVLENSPEEDAIPSWRRPPDFAEMARRQIAQDLGAAPTASIFIEQGAPVEAILRLAKSQGCDLIVTGVARSELLGRFSLGATVDGILRGSDVPVLVVKSRAARAYDRIVVATDFSECSRSALDAAAVYFPGRRLTVFHAYDAPRALLLSDPDGYRRERRQAVRQEGVGFLRAAGRDPDMLLVEFGAPDQLLRQFALEKSMDLVVLGTQGRGAVAEFLIGSVAKRIVSAVPCDALMVRGAVTAGDA